MLFILSDLICVFLWFVVICHFDYAFWLIVSNFRLGTCVFWFVLVLFYWFGFNCGVVCGWVLVSW